jgi:hypothetical protein
MDNLKSNSSYNVQIQYIILQGESVLSDPTFFHTDDECKLLLTDT